MALQERTARAWMKAFAIWMLIYGILGIPMGIAYALVGPFSEGAAAAVMGILYAAFGVLSLLCGAGVWTYRSWVRTLMIVLGWIGAAVALLVLAGALLIGSLGATILPEEVAAAGAPLAILLLVSGLLLAASVILHLWLFQFDPTVRSLFAGTGLAMPGVDAGNALEVTQGWAALTALSAVLLAAAGVFLGILGVVAGELTAGAEEAVLLAAFVFIGIILVIFAVLFLFLARGLWRLREWARLVSLAIAYIMGVLGAGYVLLAPVMGILGAVPALDIATGIVSGLYYLALAAAEIWFFQFNKDVKALFATGQAPAAVKKKRASR